jgi:hypothetical protein
MNEGMGSVAQDLSGSRNHIDTFSGGAAWGVGLGGPGLMCGYNNADYTSAPDHPLHTGNPGTTLLVWATNNKDTVTSSGSEFLISKLNSFNLFWSQGEQVGGSVRIGSSTKSFGTPISTQVNGTRLSLYGFVHNNLTATPIFNGVVYTANAVAAVGAVDNTANALLFGGDGGNSSWDGTIYAVALYAVALSIPEIASLSRDPYAMLQQDPIELWAGATMGGGSVTNVTVEPDALSAILGVPAPATQYDFLHAVSALTAQVAIQNPGIDLDYLHAVSSLALQVALRTPAEHFDFQQAVSALSAELTLHSPVVAFGQTAVISALSMLVASPAPQANYDFAYSPSVLSALVAAHSPTLSYDYTVALGSALSLAATLQAVDVSTGVNVTVEPGTQQLVLTIANPAISWDYVHAISASLGLTCTLLVPDVSGEVGRTYIVCSSTDPAQLDFYIGGVLVARFT